MDSYDIGLGLVWFLAFVLSATVHEAAHALAALKLGDSTAYQGGQVTLNPIPHIQREPVGMILVPILSYVLAGWCVGWASAPYNPYWAERYPKRAAWMALAGPASNFVIVLICFIIIRIGINADFFYAPDTISNSMVTQATEKGAPHAIAVFVSIFFTLNLVLTIFNLIPLPPLDGSAVLGLFIKGSDLQRYNDLISQPGASIIGLVIAWNLFKYLFNPIHLFMINLLYPGSYYS